MYANGLSRRKESNIVSEITTQDRFRGCLLGLAAGDALGTTLEFRRPGTFEPISDIVGGGPFNLKPGQWTDDTSMALCLATSLIERGGFDAGDQMDRYLRWWREGLPVRHGGMLRHREHHSSCVVTLRGDRRTLLGPNRFDVRRQRFTDATGSGPYVLCRGCRRGN